MLDIRFIREHPEVVRKDLQKRNEKEKLEWLEDLLKSDVEHRRLLQENQRQRQRRNEPSKAGWKNEVRFGWGN